MSSDAAPRTFPWRECVRTLERLAAEEELTLDPEHRFFETRTLRIRPPLVFPIAPGCDSLAEYLDDVPDEPGAQLVILMQAGAVSMGRFDRGECLATKTLKRYVVRGKGRAQPVYLEAKGKSRYGSRLRLQNARLLMQETSAKLLEWNAELGPARLVFYNCPPRLWPSLFETRPAPPFEQDGPLVRIPLDVPRPTTEVLMRTYRKLEFGRIEPRSQT